MRSALRRLDRQTAQSGGPCQILLSKGLLGLHIGFLFQENEESGHCYIHMEWHEKLRVEEPPHKAAALAPEIDEDTLLDLCTRLSSIRHHPLQRVAFGLELKDQKTTRKGRIDVGRGSGLNCATFLLIVFRDAGIHLLDLPTWEQRSVERLEEDTAFQQSIVDHLREEHPDHADKLAREIGSPRFRPEEVAAAAGTAERPLSYTEAESLGLTVKSAVQKILSKKS